MDFGWVMTDKNLKPFSPMINKTNGEKEAH